MAIGVVNDNYEIISRAQGKTRHFCPAEAILEDMASLCRQVVGEAGLSMNDIEYIGIGNPGSCNEKAGIVEYCNNLDFVNLPVAGIIKEKLHRSTYILNDADAVALAESRVGAARGADSCVCITLGTGIGGGIIIGGKIYNGINHSGGELGHMVIERQGIPCNCGRTGCWEAYASATALIQQTRDAMKQHPDSILWELAPSLPEVTGKTVFDAMRQGDPVGKAVVDCYIDYLACGLINVINIFQPEVICIGGGICKESDTLLNPLRARIAAERYSRYSQTQTNLCVAALGNDAGIIGAACVRR